MDVTAVTRAIGVHQPGIDVTAVTRATSCRHLTYCHYQFQQNGLTRDQPTVLCHNLLAKSNIGLVKRNGCHNKLHPVE